MSALPQTRPRAATGPSLAARAKRWLYLLHRWAGITLCLFFAMWFISGVVMMYVGYPKLTPAERLGHLAPLDPAGVTVTPAQALAAAGLEDGAALSLSASRAGQAVYLAGGGRRAAPRRWTPPAARCCPWRTSGWPPPRPRPGSAGPTGAVRGRSGRGRLHALARAGSAPAAAPRRRGRSGPHPALHLLGHRRRGAGRHPRRTRLELRGRLDPLALSIPRQRAGPLVARHRGVAVGGGRDAGAHRHRGGPDALAFLAPMPAAAARRTART